MTFSYILQAINSNLYIFVLMKKIFKVAVPLAVILAVGVYFIRSFEDVFEKLSIEPEEFDDYDER